LLKNHRISIEGHTDDIGDEDYNLRLSEKRAQAVKQYLIANFSIAPDLLTVKGFGENRPIAGNNTSWGRAQNRRVEFVNLGEAGAAAALPGQDQVMGQPLPEAQAAVETATTEQQPLVAVPPREKLKIAILELDYLNKTGAGDPMGKMISEFLTTAAVNTAAFNIAEREQLAKVLKELELNQTGIINEGEAREIGRMVGAEVILTGSVSRIGNAMRIDARFIDVESGNIIAATEQIIPNCNDMQGISTATKNIINILVTKLP